MLHPWRATGRLCQRAEWAIWPVGARQNARSPQRLLSHGVDKGPNLGEMLSESNGMGDAGLHPDTGGATGKAAILTPV